MKNIIVTTLAFTLLACGGGGENDSEPTPSRAPNELPVVTVSPNSFTMEGGAAISITPTATDADGSVVSIVWTQTSGEIITFESVDGLLQLVAPVNLQTEQTYSFLAEATDNDGGKGSAGLDLTVKAMPDLDTLLLGPEVADDNLTSAAVVTPNYDTTEVVDQNPSVSFNQTSGEILIANGRGVRSAEVSLAQAGDEALSFEVCRHVAMQVQDQSGCLMKVIASDLSKVILATAQVYDAEGNQLRLTVN